MTTVILGLLLYHTCAVFSEFPLGGCSVYFLCGYNEPLLHHLNYLFTESLSRGQGVMVVVLTLLAQAIVEKSYLP